MQIKTMLDETRNQLQTSKNQHLRQIELMESEELIAQKKVRSEMIQMEDVLALIRKEYEALRIEFEQNMAANEQTAPINREMRHLITSLQNHNGQLKGEVQRYKRKYKDTSTDNLKLRNFGDEARKAVPGEQAQGHHGPHPPGAAQHDRAGEGDDGQAEGHHPVPDEAEQSSPPSRIGADLRHGPGCPLQRTTGPEGIRLQAQPEAEREQGLHAVPDARPGDAGGGDQHQGEHLQDRRGRLHDSATGPEISNLLVGQHYLQYRTQ